MPDSSCQGCNVEKTHLLSNKSGWSGVSLSDCYEKPNNLTLKVTLSHHTFTSENVDLGMATLSQNNIMIVPSG